MATAGSTPNKPSGRNPSGTSYWELPKGSGVKIHEMVNRSVGRDYGVSYQVVIPRKVTGHERIRRQFPTFEDAKEYATMEMRGKEEYGQRHFDLTGRQRAEALSAFNLLPAGASLIEAVRFYKRHRDQEQTDVLLADAVKEFLDEQGKLNLRPRSLADLHHRLNVFLEAFEGRSVAGIDTAEIREWLAGQSRLSARSLKNFRNTVARFFNWSLEHNYRLDNPAIAKKVPLPKIDWKPPVILSVKETKRLLGSALQDERDKVLIPFLTLSAFAGLRTAEISRLDWKSVDLDRRLVTIGVDQAKKRRLRSIDLTANAVAWLRLCERDEGPVAPGNLYVRLAAFRKDAGFTDWKEEKSNALRHSFGSYHFALFEDAALTASKLGHQGNDDQLFDHYRSLVTKEDAEQYFAITPESVGEGSA